jgi:glycosyltransferase involved in cell wall biosynthesis
MCRRFDKFWGFWFHIDEISKYFAEQEIHIALLNDASSWPLARFLPKGVVILDAHEYSPDELSDSLKWRLFMRPFKIWCSSFACLGTHRFCVEPRLCHLWKLYSGFDFDFLPNSSYYVKPPVTFKSYSTVLSVIHHGIAHRSRRLELMIEAIAMGGNRFKGIFLLAGSDKLYIRRLQALARPCDIQLLPPIPQADLIAFCAQFDIAILSIFPSNTNYKYCLPNKLYQFIQSRLPIVCGPTPAIAEIVTKYEIGVVADDFSAASLSKALHSLTPERLLQMRVNIEVAAQELCWEKDQLLLVSAVSSIVQLNY